MFYISDIKTVAPQTFQSELQENVYRTLNHLNIPFERVDTDEAITMDDCTAIDAQLGMQMVKTLFLCNHQQTEFYLFVTRGDKPFRAKDFSHALGVSRVSFAPAELMLSMLGTHIGAATVLSVVGDEACRVRVVIDAEVAASEWYGCSDGLTTSFMKLRTDDVLHRFLPYVKHEATIIHV